MLHARCLVQRFFPIVSVLLITGCAHSLVYDENRDKQAQEAQQAVTDAHVAGVVASLDKLFADVSAREEQNARDRQTYLFDLEIQSVASASSLTSEFKDTGSDVDGLITVVNARLADLGVADRADAGLTGIRRSVVDLAADRGALNLTLAEFRGAIGYQFTSCAEVYAAAADPKSHSQTPSARFIAANPMKRAVQIRNKFMELIQACVKVDADIKNQQALFAGGIVNTLRSGVANLDQELLDYELARRAAQAEVDDKVKAFDLSAAKAAAKEHASAAESAQKGAQSVLGFLGTIGKANDVAAAHVVAEEKLKRLEAVLTAIAGTPSDGKVELTTSDKVAVAIVGDLPALADEANKLFSAAAKPRTIPFLAAIDHEKLVLKGFEDAQQAKRKQRAAAFEQMQAAMDESAALARVLQSLNKDPKWAKQSISGLEKDLKPEEKVRLHRALATYADEVQQHRIDGAVWLVRERSAQYEEGLAQSKAIASQWDGLMDTEAKVLADYHAAGIKQADIAEFFKALGLVAVGVGVAQ